MSDRVIRARVGEHEVVCYERARVMIVDGISPIKLTPKEYSLMEQLLGGKLVKDVNLKPRIFDDLTSEKAIQRHIDRMRDKLEPAALYIYRRSSVGYYLGSLDSHLEG